MNRIPYFLLVALCLHSTGHAYTGTAELAEKCLTGEIEISGHTVLPSTCRHTATLTIRTSGTVLDCQGSIIDGENTRPVGIAIESDGRPLRNVEVHNCVVLNAKYHGINIGWSLPDRVKSERHTHKELYRLSPADTLLKNVNIRNAGRTGLYVDDYVTGTVVDNTTITNSGGVGIYLEHSSRKSTVRNSRITDNGFTLRREGIAVDSSSGNVIHSSVITGNALGGIFLYRNCSEHFDYDAKQVKRWQSADHNLIERNRISGGKAGVWIASRQSMDTSMMRCGNGYYAEEKYTLDSAKHNKILNNQIEDSDFGVLVEDDNNTVTGNRLSRVRKVAIQIGSIPRFNYLKLPVVGTKINNNVISESRETVKFIGGSQSPISARTD